MSKTRFVAANGLSDFLGFIADQGKRVLAPVEKKAASKTVVVFEPWTKGKAYTLAKAAVSPKEAVLPECETLFVYGRKRSPQDLNQFDTSVDIKIEAQETVIFACRTCDARGFVELDKPYLQGLYQDPYYRAKREKLTVISLTCNSGCETCFCHWVKGGPTSPAGSDILMTEIADGYVLQAITARGQELLDKSSLPDGAEKFHEAEEVRKKAWASLVPAPDLSQAPEKLARIFNNETFWRRMTNKCISCGACTYMCPTCYCFNITDEGTPQAPNGGRRYRSWDNCMSALYTREASGHNPRPEKYQRMRNRISHKFWTFPSNWGSFLCSGCGRCIVNCPVHLDIRAITLAAIACADKDGGQTAGK